jgi:GT2 family glycosyltransferase
VEKVTGMSAANISLSVVSHQQIELIGRLLQDIEKHCRAHSLEVILTLNMREVPPFDLNGFSFPVMVIENSIPQGFAANHDQAFSRSTGRYFCVINPDIRLDSDPFQIMMECLEDQSVGVVGPLVLNTQNAIEDSARKFPGPLIILCKLFGKCRGGDYKIGEEIILPDWVGGMCMLFRRDVYKQLGGFDRKFFLYYEDVDLCARMWLHGYKVALVPKVRVIHEARRDSHRKTKFLKWHLASMLKFFLSPVYWRVKLFR